MPPTTIKSEETQQTRKSEEETLFDFLLESIMGFPMDSDARQALNAAGVMSVKDLLLLDGEVRPANLYGWNG